VKKAVEDAKAKAKAEGRNLPMRKKRRSSAAAWTRFRGLLFRR